MQSKHQNKSRTQEHQDAVTAPTTSECYREATLCYKAPNCLAVYA
jgi:hypothetical protein